MNIVHIVASAPYNDNWGYQDNLLPRYHRGLGHRVTVLVLNEKQDNGKIVKVPCSRYRLNDGVEVIRLKRKKVLGKRVTNILSLLPIGPALEELKPAFIFSHGLCSATILAAIRYRKKANPNCVIVQDNHMDYFNGVKTTGLAGKVFRLYYRTLNRISQKSVACVFGVTPWRMEYAEQYFHIRHAKLRLLVMGGDDEKIRLNDQPRIRKSIREELALKDDDFVIVTGGKIDRKKNIHLLMRAVSELDGKAKLIVFGAPDEEMRCEIKALSTNKNIRYIEWLPSEKVYDYFLSADLAVFPGTHSVLWEQACACGVPCIFKEWEGMRHVDVGGNCRFLNGEDVEEIQREVLALINSPDEYEKMKKTALDVGVRTFSYLEIAKRSLEIAEKAIGIHGTVPCDPNM